MSDNPTQVLARYAASTSIKHLPAEVRERAKLVIFDEIACSYYGAHSLAGDLAARYAAQAGGAAESRIYATGIRVSAPNAALANGAAGHGEEVDGAHVVGGHPGASIVHAAVATAERQRTTGAELINAVVLGYDVGIRIIEACGGLFRVRDELSLNSDFLHALGCATASGRLLGLDERRLCYAMGLASFGSNALACFYAEGRHISKSLCNGMHASAGVTGALMAAAGLESHEDILGAKHGILNAWGISDLREATTRDLGQTFRIMGGNFKFLNAGYPIHAPVEAALTLRNRHKIKIKDIAAVYIGMPSRAAQTVNNRAMHNICAQDMVSAALVLDGLKLRGSPFPEVLDNPQFVHLRPRVTLQGDPELDRDQPSGRGAIVKITLASGEVLNERVEHPKGHSLRGGATWSDLEKKWREGLPDRNIDRLLGRGQRLEDIDDMTGLLDAFQTRDRG